jgi:hypothetical protein
MPADILVHLGEVGTLVVGSVGIGVALLNQRRQKGCGCRRRYRARMFLRLMRNPGFDHKRRSLRQYLCRMVWNL